MVDGTGAPVHRSGWGTAETLLIQGNHRPSSEEVVCEEPAVTFYVQCSATRSSPHFPSCPPHAPIVPSSVTHERPVSGALRSFSLGPIDLPSRPLHVLEKNWGGGWPFQIIKEKMPGKGWPSLSGD